MNETDLLELSIHLVEIQNRTDKVRVVLGRVEATPTQLRMVDNMDQLLSALKENLASEVR